MLDNARAKGYKCEQCNYTTNRSFDLRRHQQRHERVKPLDGVTFKCTECQLVTKWKRNMGRHMEKHKRNAAIQMEEGGEEEQSQQLDEDQAIEEYIVEVIEAEEDEYEEELKGAVEQLNTNVILELPQEETHQAPPSKSQKRFKCELCRYTSNRAFDLRRHKQTHFRVKVVDGMAYKCSECNFLTKWKRNMRRHMRKHEDPDEDVQIKEVKEEVCEETHEETIETFCEPVYEPQQVKDEPSSEEYIVELINAELLNSDLDMATIYPAPSECSETQEGSEAQSQEEVPEKRFKCNQCEYESKRAYDLRRHSQVHKKIKPIQGIAYQCNECSFITKWKRNMRRHMEKHKPNPVVEAAADEQFIMELKSNAQMDKRKIKLEDDPEVLPSYWIALPST
ncbi:zinc finger protein 43 [Drosophila mojavensis]|uniref:C2H2-type domain-containing protein n=1 Tax=Drosophila mojavensis TaxID=7230 RepID=B4KTH5_DROMO|nr:zinc finger protein 43 [Drosophila mojavensis]EDW08536.1 uncharacterized protein Dmoj_GI20017 [Drosophila mojavensis]